MTVWINVNYEGFWAELAQARDGKGLTQKAKRLLLTQSNMKTVQWWKNKFIPRHFEAKARSRYHYAKRSKSYLAIKKALARNETVIVHGRELPKENIKKQGEVDIVRKGDTEAMAKTRTVARGTPTYGRIDVLVPRYIARRYAGKPNMKRELQTLTADEHQQLVRIWRKTHLAGLRVLGQSAFLKRRLGKRSGKI